MNMLNPQGDIALTAKGEAYAVANMRPVGCPAGIDPVTWRRAVEARAETLLDMVAALMASLDQMDADPDLEPSMGWAWPEPVHGYAPDADMCEVEDDKCVCDDPHDGCLDMGELDTADNEYSLGWGIPTETTCQGLGYLTNDWGDREQDSQPVS